MDLALSEEHIRFRNEVREFAKNELKPKAAELDRTGNFPWEILRRLGQKGLLGIPIPKEYGGLGLDTISYLIGLEELSYACGSTGVITAVHTSVGTYPIYLFGTEEQRHRLVKPLAKGEKLGAFALTEPEAGSDARAITTTAEPMNSGIDGYILNGTKLFITNGTSAETVIVIAASDKTKGHKGFSAFVVEKNMEGFKQGQKETKLGLHASEATELIFENCNVPAENLLGTPGDGFKISMITLDAARLGIAAQALGVARAAFAECYRFAQNQIVSGKPLAKQEGIRFIFSDMATALAGARLLMYKGASFKDQQKPFTKEASMAKLLATETAMNIVNTASHMMGEIGYTKRSSMERYLRDVKVTEIYEGTSEIQRIVIAKQLMK